MSKPIPGNYYIINATQGEGLLASYTVRSPASLYVTRQGSPAAQLWTIKDSGDGQTQTISIDGFPKSQVASVPGPYITIVDGSEYPWTIRGDPLAGYTIEGSDPSGTFSWGLHQFIEGERISKDPAPSDDEQTWLFIRVPS